MKKITIAMACIACCTLSLAQSETPAPAPATPSAATPSDTPHGVLIGQVISRTPVYQQVAVASPNCTSSPVAVQGPKSGAGAMMGAIAGAAVGSQIGGGQGQALATMAGIVGGALLGDNIEKPAPSQIANATTCTSSSVYENRLIGYQVVYEFSGKQYTVQLPQDPGATIALQVSPVAMAQAPVATTTVITPAPNPPQVIYTPPPTVVYGAPYYYGNPFPFSTSIHLGWGFRGGHGRRWH